jgi:hypothetical protein
VIPGYAQTPEAQHPPAHAGGSIAEVEAARSNAPKYDKEPCPECGKPISAKNLNTHRRKIHGVRMRRGRPVANAEAPKQDKPAPVKRTKVTTEEIIVTVVSLRWPNGVPVDKIGSLLFWANATERFLNE